MPTILEAMTANWYKQKYDGKWVYVNMSRDLYITEKDLKAGNGNIQPFKESKNGNTSAERCSS